MNGFLKRTWAEIHLERLRHNIKEIKTLISENAEIMAVVKANAYGHDDLSISRELQGMGIKYFAVSNLNEAIALRENQITSDILILGYTGAEDTNELISNNIISTVISEEHAIALNNSAKSPLRVHIKIDTGMNRIGLTEKSIENYVNKILEINALENISVEGIFTHLCVADSDDAKDISFTNSQKELILNIKNSLLEKGLKLKHFHYLNSAGGTYLNDKDSTLARFGIMIYGLHPNYSLALPVDLLPVMELKSIISHIKPIKSGETVGYGRTYTAQSDRIIATVPIGYADGYARLLSGKASVLVAGKRAKIVGNVCMDQLMIDVTDIEGLKVGDSVTLIGIDGDEIITADELAELYGTIGYEVVCGISKRVPRVILDNDKIISIRQY